MRIGADNWRYFAQMIYLPVSLVGAASDTLASAATRGVVGTMRNMLTKESIGLMLPSLLIAGTERDR